MKDRVAACIYPDSTSCRGCSHSYNPALYDGGCMLHYEGGGAKSLEALELETVAQPHAQKEHIQTGD